MPAEGTAAAVSPQPQRFSSPVAAPVAAPGASSRAISGSEPSPDEVAALMQPALTQKVPALIPKPVTLPAPGGGPNGNVSSSRGFLIKHDAMFHQCRVENKKSTGRLCVCEFCCWLLCLPFLLLLSLLALGCCRWWRFLVVFVVVGVVAFWLFVGCFLVTCWLLLACC